MLIINYIILGYIVSIILFPASNFIYKKISYIKNGVKIASEFKNQIILLKTKIEFLKSTSLPLSFKELEEIHNSNNNHNNKYN